MYDFAEFEIHVICPDDWAPPEAWLVIIHKPCGQQLKEQADKDRAPTGEYDMLDFQSAAQLAMGHKCERS